MNKAKTITDHWLDDARRVPSPNYNQRPEGEISLLVIHNISLPPAQFGTPNVEQFFQNILDANEHPYFEEIADLQVSSHLFIRRTGEVVQFVPFNERAWHAGLSSYGHRDNCNDYSIGIELEGTDDIPYEDIQYQVLAEVSQALMTEYPEIAPSRISGHEFIAPRRKTDPGRAFSWQRLFHDLTRNEDLT